MGYYERNPWRDIMQVCTNGHVVNAGFQKYPHRNKEFCDKCGAKTITTCPACDAQIPGDMQDTGVTIIGFTTPAPEFCQNCGNPFPWKGKVAKALPIKVEHTPIETLKIILSKFHTIVKQLRQRHDNRNTLDVSDEYDVQDFLHALLKLFYEDIRVEEWTPSYAGKCARMDFLLNDENIVVEVKMTRKGLGEKDIGDQLLVDIDRYKEHKKCKNLICFIYDPDGRITNPKGLIKDLEKKSNSDLNVMVFVNPI